MNTTFQIFNSHGLRSAEGHVSREEVCEDGVLLVVDILFMNAGYIALLLGANPSQLLSGAFVRDGAPFFSHNNKTVFRYRFNPESIYLPETWMRDVYVFGHSKDGAEISPVELLRRFP